LKRNPKFKLIDAKEILPPDFTMEGMFKTLPFKHDMDGAFAAKMRKTR
jgi:16S rRNA C967 or C1407 C5-methylase (RsmB/RsmF family)